jgi:hypothetical protein
MAAPRPENSNWDEKDALFGLDTQIIIFFYFSFVLMLLRYSFAYRNRKKREIIIILKIVKFNFLMLTDTVVSRQTADVTLDGILQL